MTHIKQASVGGYLWQSVVLYGAPIWAGDLAANKMVQDALHRQQRKMVARVVRAYRTVPFETACVVSGCLPWALTAVMHVSLYWRRAGFRHEGVNLTPWAVDVLKRQARQHLLLRWQCRLAHARAGLRVVGALRPILLDWVERRQGVLTFRMVQVFTGHECFG